MFLCKSLTLGCELVCFGQELAGQGLLDSILSVCSSGLGLGIQIIMHDSHLHTPVLWEGRSITIEGMRVGGREEQGSNLNKWLSRRAVFLKSPVSHWIFRWSDQLLLSVRCQESERIHSYGAACGKLYKGKPQYLGTPGSL